MCEFTGTCGIGISHVHMLNSVSHGITPCGTPSFLIEIHHFHLTTRIHKVEPRIVWNILVLDRSCSLTKLDIYFIFYSYCIPFSSPNCNV